MIQPFYPADVVGVGHFAIDVQDGPLVFYLPRTAFGAGSPCVRQLERTTACHPPVGVDKPQVTFFVPIRDHDFSWRNLNGKQIGSLDCCFRKCLRPIIPVATMNDF